MRTIRLSLFALPAIAALIFIGLQTSVLAQEQGQHDDGDRVERQERDESRVAGRPGNFDQRRGPECGPQGCRHDGRWQGHDGRGCRSGIRCVIRTVVAVMVVVHVLLAVWVFGDIRKRGEGSGIFIVLTLLIGVPGAALYMLARIGDRKIAEQKTGS